MFEYIARELSKEMTCIDIVCLSKLFLPEKRVLLISVLGKTEMACLVNTKQAISVFIGNY